MYKIYRNDVETLNPSFKEKEEIISCLIDNRLVDLDEEPETWRECESLEEAKKELSYLETYVSKISGRYMVTKLNNIILRMKIRIQWMLLMYQNGSNTILSKSDRNIFFPLSY